MATREYNISVEGKNLERTHDFEEIDYIKEYFEIETKKFLKRTHDFKKIGYIRGGLEIKIKKFLKRTHDFKKIGYIRKYCPKFTNLSLDRASGKIINGRIKIEDDFKANYRIEIGYLYGGRNKFYLSIGNLTNQGVYSSHLNRVINFNESLAKKLHIQEICADAMNGCDVKNEIEAYEQRGYKIMSGYFGTRSKTL